MADPRAVAAQHRRDRAEMRRLADLAAAATDPADRQQHLVALWEQAVIAGTANQTCRFRHTGCTRRATRAVWVGVRAATGRAYDPRNGSGACASCYARERARRSLDQRRAAAAPPAPRARSVAGLMRSYGLR